MDNEKIPMIYGAICGVMESIGAVGKNDVNKQQGFKYRSIEAVMNALNPALVKNNIFCTPEVLEQHNCKGCYTNIFRLPYKIQILCGGWLICGCGCCR